MEEWFRPSAEYHRDRRGRATHGAAGDGVVAMMETDTITVADGSAACVNDMPARNGWASDAPEHSYLNEVRPLENQETR